MKKAFISWMISFVVFLCALTAFGQQASQPAQYRQEPAPVSIHKISPNVYELRGGLGANCSFIVGEKEVFVIDAKMSAQSAKDMTDYIRKTTNKPISHIILTHSDGDHVNGLSGFSEGSDIIAHANSRKHMEKANEGMTEKIPLPAMTFSDRMNLYSGDLRVDLLYLGPAHTDGDIVILVPEDKTAIVGDLFFKDRDPLIHVNKNGNSFGLVDVLSKLIDLDAQTYLSGHAEPVTKADIEGLRSRIIEIQSKVKALADKGMTLDEVKKTLGISTAQGRWPSLAEVIYLELTRDKQK